MDQHEQPAETSGLPSERLDTLLRALAAEPRRMIYIYLAEHDSATVTELTDVVVGWVKARGRDADACNWDDTRTALHHRHLPVLDDAGIVPTMLTSRPQRWHRCRRRRPRFLRQ